MTRSPGEKPWYVAAMDLMHAGAGARRAFDYLVVEGENVHPATWGAARGLETPEKSVRGNVDHVREEILGASHDPVDDLQAQTTLTEDAFLDALEDAGVDVATDGSGDRD